LTKREKKIFLSEGYLLALGRGLTDLRKTHIPRTKQNILPNFLFSIFYIKEQIFLLQLVKEKYLRLISFGYFSKFSQLPFYTCIIAYALKLSRPAGILHIHVSPSGVVSVIGFLSKQAKN